MSVGMYTSSTGLIDLSAILSSGIIIWLRMVVVSVNPFLYRESVSADSILLAGVVKTVANSPPVVSGDMLSVYAEWAGAGGTNMNAPGRRRVPNWVDENPPKQG